jgi:hypothetical protein
VTVTARTQIQGLGGSACGSGGIMRGSAGRVYDVSASLYTFLVSARCRAASNRRYVAAYIVRPRVRWTPGATRSSDSNSVDKIL